jgi:hypothetical protein
VICLLACLIAIPVLAQQRGGADPLTGTWAGDWGPNQADRNQVTVDLKLEGGAVTGVVKTANRPEVPLSKGTFDATARTVKMEAVAPRGGATVRYIIEGKLEGNTLTGSWNHDNTKGDFKLTKK